VVVEVSSARLAVLIDAENAPLWAVGPLLAEVGRYGRAQVKRAYGDWTVASLKAWKKTLLDQSVRPVQVFAAVRGKNASDMALVIEAMDLLHSGTVDGFCLVSSDSDFTRLAERIREAGLRVYGFGEEKKTNPGLVAACDSFVFVESLAAGPPSTPAAPVSPPGPGVGQPILSVVPSPVVVPVMPVAATVDSGVPTTAVQAPVTTSMTPIVATSAGAAPSTGAAAGKKKKRRPKTSAAASNARGTTSGPTSPARATTAERATTTEQAMATRRATTAELRADAALVSRLRDAVATNRGSDGWTPLSAIGQAIRKRPAVVVKPYGYSRLKDLIGATDLFEIQQRGAGGSSAVYVRVQ
jgi:hypothetical protein